MRAVVFHGPGQASSSSPTPSACRTPTLNSASAPSAASSRSTGSSAEHHSWCKEMPVLGDALRRHTRSVRGTEYDEQREGRRITAGLQQRPGHPRKRLTDG
jgi:hypothetical protein